MGQEILQQLNDHAGILGVSALQHGVLWTIEAAPHDLAAVVQEVIHSGILFNRASHECLYYD